MKKLVLIGVFAGLGLSGWPAPLTFDFKDPKKINNVVFKTDAVLESINGTATEVSGSVVFDPANPGAVKGKLVVEASSLHVPNALMQTHLQSATWLDVEKHPLITFELIKAANVKTTDNTTTADVTGTLTIKDVSRQITVPVKMTFLKDKLKDRTDVAGDLLVVRGTFTIKRSDYDINKGNLEDKVSDDIELSLSLAGQAPH